MHILPTREFRIRIQITTNINKRSDHLYQLYEEKEDLYCQKGNKQPLNTQRQEERERREKRGGGKGKQYSTRQFVWYNVVCVCVAHAQPPPLPYWDNIYSQIHKCTLVILFYFTRLRCSLASIVFVLLKSTQQKKVHEHYKYNNYSIKTGKLINDFTL